MKPIAALLSDGKRLHLQHGPIDLIIGADGDRNRAFEAARRRFETVLEEVVHDLPLLRAQAPAPAASSTIGRRMQQAVAPLSKATFVTAMAAVAGSVAETILAAMVQAADLDRAYVNNGGDIALHLTPGQRFKMAMASIDGQVLGQIDTGDQDPVRGIATSGRHGRSHSMGIADSVTVLAKSAAVADVAATLIANAVDLPGNPKIMRTPASEIDDITDLGERLIVTDCGVLSKAETADALARGTALAHQFQAMGHITSACLFLNGQSRATASNCVTTSQGTLEYA